MPISATVTPQDDVAPLVKQFSRDFPHLDAKDRQAFLTNLIDFCSARELAHLSSLISPRLKVDFLSTLPIEVSLQIISYMDLKSLARASGVSRFWRSLVNDEHTWKVMCRKYQFRQYVMMPSRSFMLGLDTPDRSLQSPETLEASSSSESEAYTHHLGNSASMELPDSNQVLSSLYETYIARGLDAATALSELKALHTLFLSKRAREMGVEERRRQLHALQNEGAFAHLVQDQTVLDRVGQTSMSQEDKQFYQALEEFVLENRGPTTIIEQDSTNAGLLSTGMGSSRTVGGPQTPEVPSSFVGPPTSVGAVPSQHMRSIVSPTGRLGSMTSGLLNSFWDRSGNASDSGHPPSSGDHGHSNEGHADGDIEMLVDRDVVAQDDTMLPSDLVGPSLAPALGLSSLGRGLPSWQTMRAPPLRAATFAERGMSALGFHVGGGHGSGTGAHVSVGGVGATPKRSVSTGYERANSSNPYRHPSSRRSKPFSYKTHFKLAYLTESNWLRGGRLLTQHVSSDDASGEGPVVTTLSIDDEWIIVGMANAKIHVFDARTGLFVKTLVGHSSGVWCMSLISASTLGAKGKGKAKEAEQDAVSAASSAASLGAYPYDNDRPLYRPTPDLNLIHHDPRPTANTFSPEITSHELPTAEETPMLSHMPRVGERLPSWSTTGSFDSSTEPIGSDQAPSSAPPAGGTSSRSSRGAGLGSNFGSPCGSVQGYGNTSAIVVSGGCDRDVRVWDLSTGECKYVLSGHRSTVRCLRVLEGRPIAISGARDGTLRVWNVETGVLVHMLAGHQHSVRCLDVAGNLVASASYDCTCRIWNVDTGKCIHVLRGHYHQIYAVAFDGVRIATGSLDSTVRVWSAETG